MNPCFSEYNIFLILSCFLAIILSSILFLVFFFSSFLLLSSFSLFLYPSLTKVFNFKYLSLSLTSVLTSPYSLTLYFFPVFFSSLHTVQVCQFIEIPKLSFLHLTQPLSWTCVRRLSVLSVSHSTRLNNNYSPSTVYLCSLFNENTLEGEPWMTDFEVMMKKKDSLSASIMHLMVSHLLTIVLLETTISHIT